MRFLANGPSIPDELLTARDQGRVIFFCGAGVSRAHANLPDFFGLAESVVEKLRVETESSIRKLIFEAKEIDKRVGVTGVISADRIFGLLERDFSTRDIVEAVAQALKPSPNCNLHAHSVLIQLATTAAKRIQLVTTNFDRLFDDCSPGVRTWQPPRLPNPLRPKEIDGIIYLHGKVTSDYMSAEGDGFVLSSSEFGRAYLSEGWATSFIRDILRNFVVVFVGYSADDPPVQYLLEALRGASEELGGAYAFQSGTHEDAVARWRHKGVQAIPYPPENAHSALWSSLVAWAERASDPGRWQLKVIEHSRLGPEALQPHERGQLAHVVSTYEGALRFCTADPPPPANWLCVFDPSRRFAKPGYLGSFGTKGSFFDPFEAFGLDSDIRPAKVEPGDHYAKREVPPDAWDAFKHNRLDLTPLKEESLASIRGLGASRVPRLAPRIAQLGFWIAGVCHEPAAVWWASHQSSLHNDIQQRIEWRLSQLRHSDIHRAWHFLMEAWRQLNGNGDAQVYRVGQDIKRYGWDNYAVRRFADAHRPYFSVRSPIWGGPKPPAYDPKMSLMHMIRVDVEYPDRSEKIDVPREWLASVLKALRLNLEVAHELEQEIGGFGLSSISPIVVDDDSGVNEFSRHHGVSGAVIYFTELFVEIAKSDKEGARLEWNAWANDNIIFDRLRIWVSSNPELVSSNEFKRIMSGLSEAAFWASYHQRDLLIAILARWRDQSAFSRAKLEQRLLRGPSKWTGESAADFEMRRARSALSRLTWMKDRGCTFSLDIDSAIESLRQHVSNWKPEQGENAARSMESRGGFVRTITDHQELLNLPLKDILSKARELSGRTSDFLIEKDPFAGLVVNCPMRAFSALTLRAKEEDFPEWAWRSFLNSTARKHDKPRFVCLIALRIASYPEGSVAKIVRPISDWLRDVANILAIECVLAFDKIVRKLVQVLQAYSSSGQSGAVRGSKEPDWTTEAINSASGRIAEAMFSDPRKENLNPGAGLPAIWANHVESLLSLADDPGRYASVICFHNLDWFYYVDPSWTERNLLVIIDGKDKANQDAAWSGFLWAANVPGSGLYKRIKSNMLELAVAPLPSQSSYAEIIAGVILAGWGTLDQASGRRYVSDDEMHTALLKGGDTFRSRVLWQAERCAREGKDEPNFDWARRVRDLLTIWPRQIWAKSQDTSARLCLLILAGGDQIPKLTELALPLLTKINRSHLQISDDIIDKYPSQILSVLYAVLSDSPDSWPYGIDATLGRLGEADHALITDFRLVELKRIWDAR